MIWSKATENVSKLTLSGSVIIKLVERLLLSAHNESEIYTESSHVLRTHILSSSESFPDEV